MRKTIPIFIVLLYNFTLIGQQNITGTLTNSDTKSVELANILLYNKLDSTTMISGTVSDSLGRFVFKNIDGGNFYISIQSLEFETSLVSFNKIKNQDKDLGTILLQVNTKLLEMVEIVGRKKLIRKTQGGFIIDAAATLSQQGGTLMDLLRNTPTVFVDAEDGISLRGKAPLILINGRNSSISNLTNIPASAIESIEIINNPSALYDSESENGIINIKLKKGNQEGFNGHVALGTGRGAKQRWNSSSGLNYKNNKLNIGLSYDNRFAERIRYMDASRVYFENTSNHTIIQRRDDSRNERTHNLRANIDYETSHHIWNFEAISAFEDEDNYETLKNYLYDSSISGIGDKYQRFSEEFRKSLINELALTYKRKFKTDSKSLTVNISNSFENGNENTLISTQDLIDNDVLYGFIYRQKTRFKENNSISNGRLDYSQKFEKITLQTGYKATIRSAKNDFGQATELSNSYVDIAAQTGILNFNEYIHAAYAQINSKIGTDDDPKMEFAAGLRAESTNNHGTIISQDLEFNNQYLNLFPNASMIYHHNENREFQFNYSRRINRPRLGQLNPFTDITDSLSQRSGNPNLKPELTHSFEIGFGQRYSSITLSTKLFYRFSTNTILPFSILKPGNVIYARPENAGNSEIYGIEMLISHNFSKFWDGNMSFSLFRQLIYAENIRQFSSNDVLGWNIKWINNFQPWKNGKIQLIGIYNAPTAILQGTRRAVYNVDIAFQQKIWKEKARIGITVTDIFNTQFSGYNLVTSEFTYNRKFKIDTRAVQVTFAYTFGTKFKEKLMENKFSND